MTGLFEAVGIACSLFINNTSRRPKVVLLHNGNVYTSLPLAYTIQLYEEYIASSHINSTVSRLAETTKWWPCWWVTKASLPSFLVIFAFGTAWILRHTTTSGTRHHRTRSLWGVTTSNSSHSWTPEVLFPPLHLKLGPMKKFVRQFFFQIR